MAEQKIFPQQIDTTGSTTGQVLFSNVTNAYQGSEGFTNSPKVLTSGSLTILIFKNSGSYTA